jgi:hypothetical protein
MKRYFQKEVITGFIMPLATVSIPGKYAYVSPRNDYNEKAIITPQVRL